MRNRLSLIPLLLVLLVAFGGAPAAAQADFKEVYTDCKDGTIDGKFTAKELQQALAQADAFVGDYSECADAIVAAQQAQASGTSTGGNQGSTGSGTTNGGTSGTGGATTPTPGATGTTSTAPSTGTTTQATTTPDRENDARDADAAERAAALAAATASADKQASKAATDLKDTGVPAAALEYGKTDTSLPGPLLLTLVACVVAACIAGGATGFQALRRRRGR